MSLKGKTILITRAEHQTGEIAGLIKKNGGTAFTFPVIQIKPPASWTDCDDACATMEQFDALIFTSTNGAENFLKRYLFLGYPVETLQAKKVYAVGEKTRQVLKKFHINVAMIPDKFTSEDLARALKEELVAGKRFLFPRGNLGKHMLIDHITAYHGEVKAVVVYLTQKAERRNVGQIRHMLLGEMVDVITFTSPSTVRHFFELIPDFKALQNDIKLAVIGPVTASALEKFGSSVDITAKESTVESLIEAIRDYFAEQVNRSFSRK